MARNYSVVDHLDYQPRTFHPTADEALAYGRTLARTLATSRSIARIVEEPCEDGTLIFGEYRDLPGELVALVWVDELDRQNPAPDREALY